MVGSVDHLPCFKDLIAVLFECFLIISLGYLSARFKLISTRAKDLNSYLTTFALPMIIFLNIAQMEFQTIDFSFLICILTAKLLVFIIVTLLTLTISQPTNFGYAGSLSILTTQSNDFALGYPLIKSLYGESKHEMLSYLSLMAPVQLLILNPLGIVMLEFHKSRKAVRRRSEECIHHRNAKNPLPPPSSQAVIINDNEMNEANHQLRLRKKTGQPTSTPTSLAYRLAGGLERDICPVFDPNDSNQSHNQDKTIGAGKLTRVDQLKGFQHKNMKSLKLVMPPTETNVIPDDTTSDKSLNNFGQFSNDSELSDYPDYPAATFTQVPTANYDLSRSMISEQIAHTPLILGALHTAEYSNHLPEPSTISVIDSSRSATPELPNVIPPCSCQDSSKTNRIRMSDLGFLKELATNPLIIASVVALIVNLTYGPELPKFVTRVSNTIAASFASPALFVVGVSMYGKFELLKKNPNDLLLSSVLVLTKGFIMPNIMRTLALIILPRFSPVEQTRYLVDFAFLYGLLPTAPTACIIANQYGILSNVVSISMILSTFLSAPLMLAASVIINPSSVIKPADIELVITQTMKISSVVTLALAALTLYAFWKSKRDINCTNILSITQVTVRSISKIKTNPTQIFLILLALCQAITGLGGLVWYFVDTGKLEAPMHKENLLSVPILNHETATISNLTADTSKELSPQSDAITSPSPEQISDAMHPPIEDLSNMIPQPSVGPMLQIESLPAPSALSAESNNGQQRQVDLLNKILSTAYYLFSSYGLMMAKFVILCLIFTIAAKKIKGRLVASRLSLIMVKIYAVLSVGLITWLLFDSGSLLHLPIEAILPVHATSLCVRLLYNVIFLVMAVPMFAYIIKSNNKLRDEVKKETLESNSSNLNSRHFVTSSSSLSSDTDSAVTANTNLESTPIAGHRFAQISPDANNNQTINMNNEPLAILTDDEICEPIKRPISSVDIQILSGPNIISVDRGCPISIEQGSINISSDSNQNQYKLVDPTNGTNIPLRSKNLMLISEFNKYSVLIVFMLINSVNNLTSILQKLLQDQPYGTFRQVEVMNVALEFGQGLITFLVYGTKGLLH